MVSCNGKAFKKIKWWWWEWGEQKRYQNIKNSSMITVGTGYSAHQPEQRCELPRDDFSSSKGHLPSLYTQCLKELVVERFLFVCSTEKSWLGVNDELGAWGIPMGEFCTFNLYNVSKHAAWSNYFISSSTSFLPFFFPVLMSWVDVNKKILPRNKMCLMFLLRVPSRQKKKKKKNQSCSEHLA